MAESVIIFPITIVVFVVMAPLTIQKIINCIKNEEIENKDKNESNEMRSIVI